MRGAAGRAPRLLSAAATLAAVRRALRRDPSRGTLMRRLRRCVLEPMRKTCKTAYRWPHKKNPEPLGSTCRRRPGGMNRFFYPRLVRPTLGRLASHSLTPDRVQPSPVLFDAQDGRRMLTRYHREVAITFRQDVVNCININKDEHTTTDHQHSRTPRGDYEVTPSID